MTCDPNLLEIGNCVFNPSTRRLCGRGGERRLSPKAAGVLLALAETPGQVWSRDALLERVWPNVIVGEEVLTHAVAELRRAFDDDSRNPHVIETIHKTGYRITPESDAKSYLNTGQRDREAGCSLNLASYAHYLEASALFDRAGTRNWERSLEAFAMAIEEDPGFALAYAGAAKALLFLNAYYEFRPDTLELVLEYCRTARRLAPHLGEPIAVEAMAHAMFGRASHAMELFGKAVQLAPNSSEVHQLLGRACFAHLEARHAPAVLERAAMLRLDDFQSAQLAATSCEMNGELERARMNFALALRRIEAWLQIFPDDYKALSGKAHCLVQLQHEEEAVSALATVCRHSDPVRHSPACVLALAGELDCAMNVLEESVDEGWRYAAWLRRDPCLNALRRTRRFQRIARSINA